MYKKQILLLLTCAMFVAGYSQTLFTYGDQKVDAKEFLRAYNKNNTAKAANRESSVREYLDLYIKSKLKVREAYERGFDSLPQIRMDIKNLRAQIADNYMADPSMVKTMVNEAFTRSLRDVHVAHIYVSFTNAAGAQDTTGAVRRKDELMNKLAAGEDFVTLAQTYSDDPALPINKSDIGFITVFTLPYEFENAVYNTPVGKYSEPVRSKTGFHIFKNLGERNAAGKIKAQQILLAIPPGADAAAEKKIAQRADSIYKRLLAGADFSKLASDLSNDYVSAATGGNLQDIAVGQYDPIFEKALWSIPKDNGISKPFRTSHGWHIVKRISVVSVNRNADDKGNMLALQERVMADSRWKSSRDFIFKQVMPIITYGPQYRSTQFYNWADSLLDRKLLQPGNNINLSTPLFTIRDTTYNAGSWLNFAGSYRFRQDGTGTKPHSQVMDEFVQAAMINYYRDHLEDFNSEFRDQMTEFKDGNLFFEIMQQEVWNKAQTDSGSLYSLYETNRKNYIWKQSADAVVFFCSDEATAKGIQTFLAKNSYDWRKAVEAYSEKVVADSARFEWEQIPGLNKQLPTEGMLTPIVVNKTDLSATFAYILKVHSQPAPRTFEEARSLVINDYQDLLEKQWVDKLRKKYPVTINEDVLRQVINDK